MKITKMTRRHARALFSGSVAIWRNRQPQLVRAKDLSAGGVFLRTDQQLGEGSLLTLRVSVPGRRGFTVLGKVVRNQYGRAPLKESGIAVEFVDIAPRDRAYLDGFVSNHSLAAAV